MLAERYRGRVVASEIDWKMMETGLEFDSKRMDRPPKRDMAVKDGDTLELGDTTGAFHGHPGHTLAPSPRCSTCATKARCTRS